MLRKPCCSRFSLHKFVHLKFFWTPFKNMHLRGSCSSRPCISRPYCTQNENCVYGYQQYQYLAACTHPRWPNQVGSPHSSISFFLDTIYGIIHSKMSEQFKKKKIYILDMNMQHYSTRHTLCSEFPYVFKIDLCGGLKRPCLSTHTPSVSSCSSRSHALL